MQGLARHSSLAKAQALWGGLVYIRDSGRCSQRGAAVSMGAAGSGALVEQKLLRRRSRGGGSGARGPAAGGEARGATLAHTSG